MSTEALLAGHAPQSPIHRLAAYLPITLIRRILDEGLPPPGQPRFCRAATLFSDIAGFTRMAEELAADGPRGAEEINRVLLLTFTAMVDIIHEAGGAVAHFHGDGMSVYFPDDDGSAATRALACAGAMQRVMNTTFNRVVVNRPAGRDSIFHLSLRIGVGYGRCLEVVVGDPSGSLEFVLAGPAVDEAGEAQKRGQQGHVMASRNVLLAAGRPAAASI
jgi:class 3 adenylate cyclase